MESWLENEKKRIEEERPDFKPIYKFEKGENRLVIDLDVEPRKIEETKFGKQRMVLTLKSPKTSAGEIQELWVNIVLYSQIIDAVGNNGVIAIIRSGEGINTRFEIKK